MKGLEHLEREIETWRQEGVFRPLTEIESEQGSRVVIRGKEVIQLSSNNYLGLTTHPRLKEAALEAVRTYGAGTGSVRTIAGTFSMHERFEEKLARFKHTEAALVFQSGFTANVGVIASILGEEDVVISDELNHASIIDVIRLCKARRYRYAHSDLEALERALQESQDAKIRLIATDGVFSMDGAVAKLKEICDLADRYDALVMVDDSHATGFFGPTGRGSVEHCGVMGRVDIITSTLGKALGGASGGFTTGRKEIIDLLRQRSRPYLFSNTVAPVIVSASLKVLDMLEGSDDLRNKLRENTAYFRERMTAAGFDIKPGEHPIVPIMLYDARLAQDMARDLLERGIYVIGFSYPVVPQGQARIRVQLSAAHTRDQLDRCINAFTEVGKSRGVV